MDEAGSNKIAAQQKKQVILPEIVTLMTWNRAIKFRLQGRSAPNPFEG
jgi:hypothetical protein